MGVGVGVGCVSTLKPAEEREVEALAAAPRFKARPFNVAVSIQPPHALYQLPTPHFPLPQPISSSCSRLQPPA